MFIEDFYNPNIPSKNYFNALHKADAVRYADEVAAKRGDTNDVGKFGKDIDIEVLMPECVRRNPEKEHGDGDPFMNSLETVIESSGSSTEAGLLVIAISGLEGARQ